MRARTLFLVGIFVLACTARAGSAELTVRIVNRTASAPPLPVLTVVLHASADGQEVSQREAQTDSQHRAVFRGLNLGEDSSYVARVSYKGVKYESESIQLTDGSKRAIVELPVYETTTSSEALQVRVQHTVVRPLRGALEVQEMYLIENRTDRTYVGSTEAKPGARRVLEFMLPSGFTDIQLGQGLMPCCIVAQGNGFVDTMEINPGERLVQFNYVLPYTRTRFTFRPALLAPTQQYNLLVSPTLRVSNVSGLEPMGEFNASREPYLRYEATNLASGAVAGIEFSSLPLDRTPLLRWLTLAVAGSLGLLLAWWVLRARRPRAVQIASVPATDRRSRLLEEIIQLDELFEAGRLAPADYQHLRNSKKAELATLGGQAHRSS